MHSRYLLTNDCNSRSSYLNIRLRRHRADKLCRLGLKHSLGELLFVAPVFLVLTASVFFVGVDQREARVVDTTQLAQSHSTAAHLAGLIDLQFCSKPVAQLRDGHAGRVGDSFVIERQLVTSILDLDPNCWLGSHC